MAKIPDLEETIRETLDLEKDVWTQPLKDYGVLYDEQIPKNKVKTKINSFSETCVKNMLSLVLAAKDQFEDFEVAFERIDLFLIIPERKETKENEEDEEYELDRDNVGFEFLIRNGEIGEEGTDYYPVMILKDSHFYDRVFQKCSSF